MPKENEAYQENYMQLWDYFHGRPIVKVSEVARWMGKDVRTVKRQLAEIITPAGISIVTLAHYLS